MILAFHPPQVVLLLISLALHLQESFLLLIHLVNIPRQILTVAVMNLQLLPNGARHHPVMEARVMEGAIQESATAGGEIAEKTGTEREIMTEEKGKGVAGGDVPGADQEKGREAIAIGGIEVIAMGIVIGTGMKERRR